MGHYSTSSSINMYIFLQCLEGHQNMVLIQTWWGNREEDLYFHLLPAVTSLLALLLSLVYCEITVAGGPWGTPTWMLFKRFLTQFSSVAHLSLTLCDPMDCKASLYFTNSWSLLKLMSIKSVMPSSHLIFCPPLLFLPSIFPSSRGFPNESILHIR